MKSAFRIPLASAKPGHSAFARVKFWFTTRRVCVWCHPPHYLGGNPLARAGTGGMCASAQAAFLNSQFPTDLPAKNILTARGQAPQSPVHASEQVAGQLSNPAQRGLSLCVLLLFISLSAMASAAGTIQPCDAVRAIVGEAAGQPYIVKLGVAEAIHNRGSLKGVYGLNAAHNRNEPAWVWRDAQRAWNQSEKTRITGGATHFGNRSDVAKGTFAGLKLTCVLGAGKDATYFFRRLA